MQVKTKFPDSVSVGWFLVKKTRRKCDTKYVLWCSVFKIHVTVKWRNHGRLVVTASVRSGLRPLPRRLQRTAPHSLGQALKCWHRPLSQLLELSPQGLWQSWQGLLLPVSPKEISDGVRCCDQGGYAIGRPGPIHGPRHVSFNHCRLSFHSGPELRRAETSISASQLQAHK
jgi:hypothetical protein